MSASSKPSSTVHQLFMEPISSFAFNGDLSQLVVSNSTPHTHIMQLGKDKKFTTKEVLEQHLERVTSVDWAPRSNRIVTCAGDRNAYVWNYQEDTGYWKPCLVLLRINRAATYVQWSPNEDRFAVGSGARLLSICYFDPEHNWWVSKHIKKPIRSTILCVDWHPSNHLIAIGSCDFKCRVFCAALKELGDKPQTSNWMPKLNKFGTLLAEFDTTNSGWVHGVGFSPSGEQLAWVAHDASVNVVNSASLTKVHTILTPSLPYSCLLWMSEMSFVAAGFGYCPDLYTVSAQGVSFTAKLDVKKEKSGGGEMSAMARFQKLDVQGQTGNAGTTVTTTHENCITEIRAMARDASGTVTKFATAGKDGRLVTWDMESLSAALGGLSL